MLKKCIILANGKPPRKQVIKYLFNKDYTTLICADGGANSALRMNLNPDFIIGDLDSITKSTYNHFKTKSKIIKIFRQNDTDVEKALKLAIKKGYNEAMLLAVTGNRLDHTFCNLGIVLKFYKKIRTKIIAENSVLTPLSRNNIIISIPGEIISLFGFNRQTKITTDGLKYPINRDSLPFGEKESTSNVSTSSEININVEGGIIFLIRDFNFLRKNDLF